jgi:hypothetical protein
MSKGMEENNSKNNLTPQAISGLLSSSEDSDFDFRVKDLLGNSSHKIKKLTIDEIADLFNIKIETSEASLLVIDEIEIPGNIHLERIASPVLIINSRLGNLEFSGLNNKKSTFSKLIYFHNTFISKFSIIHCFIKNDIWFDGKTYIENLIVNSSSLKNIIINTAIIDVFSFKKVIIGKSCQLFKSKIGNVAIDESELNDLAFNNTCIQRNLSITDSKANQLVFSKSVVKGLWLNTTNNIKTLALADKSKFSLIDFSNQCHVSEFFLTNVKLDKLKINQNCNIDKVKIDRSFITDNFSSGENVNINQILVESSFLNEIGFILTTVIQFEIESSYTGYIIFKQVNIDTIKIDRSSKTGDIVFGNCRIDFLLLNEHYGSITLVGTNIVLGHIDNSKINRLDISKGSEFEIYLKRCQINWLSFTQTSLNKNSLLSLSEGSVYCLEMDELTVHGDLHFRKEVSQSDCFKWWWNDIEDIKEVFPKGYTATAEGLRNDYLSNVEKLMSNFNVPTFRVSHSTLGKTEFTNCSLGGFRFEFNNSRITDCFISGGTIPSEKIIIIDDQGNALSQGNIENHSQKASIYNQLKKIFEAQGDAYRSAQFQAKWAEHQNKYLQLEYATLKKSAGFSWNPWKRFTLVCGELSQDIGIFKLNKWSNNHGESWVQALGFTILTTGFLFILFLWTIGRLYHSNEIGWHLFGHYIEFLTPTFKPEFITGEKPSPGSIILYYMGKAVFAYGLYQFIAAFRKHGRKK